MTLVSKIMCVVLATGAAWLIDASTHANDHPLAPVGEQHALLDLQVLALGTDQYHYEFRDDHGTIFWAHFCEDYEPAFSPGMTLNVLTYQDMGECWSVKNTHPAYLIKRDKRGKIVKEDFNVGREETAAR